MRLQYLIDKSPTMRKAALNGVHPLWADYLPAGQRDDILPASVAFAELIGWARGERVVAGAIKTPQGVTCVRFIAGNLPDDEDVVSEKRLWRNGLSMLSEVIPYETFKRLRSKKYTDDWYIDEDQLESISAVNRAGVTKYSEADLLEGEYAKVDHRQGVPNSIRTVDKWYLAGTVRKFTHSRYGDAFELGVHASPDWPYLACQWTGLGAISNTNPYRWDEVRNMLSCAGSTVFWQDQWLRLGYDDKWEVPAFRNVGLLRGACGWITEQCSPSKKPLGVVLSPGYMYVLGQFAAGAFAFNQLYPCGSRQMTGEWSGAAPTDFGPLCETDDMGVSDTLADKGGHYAAWFVSTIEKKRWEDKLKTAIVANNIKG